jgi:hypothetical protein
MKFYEISNQLNDALDDLLYNEEIDDETRYTTLDALEGQLIEKGKSVCAYILNTEAQADALKAHIKAMQGKLKTLENANSSLREYLKINMLKTGITEIKANDGTFSAKIGKGRESVVVDDESLLPESCFVIKRDVSKTAIKTAIDDGQDVPGAHIERKPTLTIK